MSIDDEMRAMEANGTFMTARRVETALRSNMDSDQKVMMEVCKVLFDPDRRGIGRSTAMFAAQIVLAVENPGREIEVIDHAYGNVDTPAAMRFAASAIEGLLAKLPQEEARCFKLTGYRMSLTDRLTIVYHPRPNPVYKNRRP